jgi:protein phosphatase
MGGAYRGEVAAGVALLALARAWRAGEGDPLLQRLERACEVANEAVVDAARSTDMGTTIVALGFDPLGGARAALAWAGDSRCGLARDGEFSWLTEDHSLVADERRRALLARRPPSPMEHLSHVVTRALGRAKTRVELVEVELRQGDGLLLCSDGVWGEWERAGSDWPLGMLSAMCSTDAEHAARNVVERAVAFGGRDNATAVVVYVER